VSACAVVFPGQGAQRAGMGRDFGAFAPARAVFDEAADALALDVRELCFGDDPRLGLTEYTQPALLAVEIAMLRVLEAEVGLRPTAFGGHSLGEYTALVAAGVIPLRAALQLTRERGRQMQAAVAPGAGAMAAITGRDAASSAVAGALEGLVVDVASINGPGQIVISGRALDVGLALDRVRALPAGKALRIHALSVSAPFHSRLMQPVETEFGALLHDAAASWDVARATRVLSNVLGSFYSGDRDELSGALARQITACVRWHDNVRALAALRPTSVIEIGPSSALRAFFIAERVPATAVTTAADVRALGRAMHVG